MLLPVTLQGVVVSTGVVGIGVVSISIVVIVDKLTCKLTLSKMWTQLDLELELELELTFKLELKLEIVFTVLADKLKYTGEWLRFHYNFSGFNLDRLLSCLQLCHKPFGFLVVLRNCVICLIVLV